MFPSYTSWKHQKTRGFFMLSGVLKRKIGLKLVKKMKTIFDIIISMIHKVKISFFFFQIWRYTWLCINIYYENKQNQNVNKIKSKRNLQVFLGKSFLQICGKFTEHSSRSVISIKLQSNFIEITLRDECSPVNLFHICSTRFRKYSSGGMFLRNHLVW